MLFGIILRRESIKDYVTDLGQVIPGRNVSARYLIAFLLQSADMGLRSRLNHYLCMNAAVPLIMNCQATFRNMNFKTIMNSELVFSMNEVEGVGVF